MPVRLVVAKNVILWSSRYVSVPGTELQILWELSWFRNYFYWAVLCCVIWKCNRSLFYWTTV